MDSKLTTSGRWLALTAAMLGWMFDGLEMGLFPLAARPALHEVLFAASDAENKVDITGLDEAELKRREGVVGSWFGIMIAGFLVGAATGGVLFGWLGDRLGRVRAMALSVLVYALFSGMCGFSNSAWSLFAWRFIASLGMGGEWALGVSLVMELWPAQSRGWLAGLIGAAANVGFVLIAIVSMGINEFIVSVEGAMLAIGMPEAFTLKLTANHGWRMLMFFGAIPALLTFFIRVFVPESERWLEEQSKGSTSHWATSDLIGVLIGTLGPLGMIYLWASPEISWAIRFGAFLPLLGIAILGYIYPVQRYLQRARLQLSAEDTSLKAVGGRSVIGMMLTGAVLSGVALMGSWGSLQWAAPWAGQLAESQSAVLHAREWTQIVIGVGAIVGTIIAAIAGHVYGRRITYVSLCLLSLASILAFYQLNNEYGTKFLVTAFIAGATTASFYGWLPLYLPELFPTKVRATGQGFSFNFGRILAAAGSLQTGALMAQFHGGYPQACSIMALIYLVGVVAIWLAPETKGQALPE